MLHSCSDRYSELKERKKDNTFIGPHIQVKQIQELQKNRSKYTQVIHNDTRKVQPKWSLSQPILLRYSKNVAKALFL
jgi:hypothetical protein